MNLVVVRRHAGSAVIDSDPKVSKTWRIDQVVEGVLYELEPYSPEIARLLARRIELLARRPTLTRDEERELARLKSLAREADGDLSESDREALEIVRDAARLIRRRAG